MALTQDQINQAYQSALGRAADAGGAQFYASQNMDYNTLLNTLAASQEAQSRAQSTPVAAPTSSSYNGLASAPVYNNGFYDYKANQTSDINSGLTYGSMTNDRDYQINKAFQAVLGRNADQAGMEYYLNSGKGVQDIYKDLYASQEYQSYNPNANLAGGVAFNQNGVRNDVSYQGMLNTGAFDYGLNSAAEYNAMLNPFTYDAQQYDSQGRLVTGGGTAWDGKSNVGVTLGAQGAKNMIDATMVSGLPTSYVDAMGGYMPAYNTARDAFGQEAMGIPSNENILKYGNNQWLQTTGMTGNKNYTEGNQYYKAAQQNPTGSLRFDAAGNVIGNSNGALSASGGSLLGNGVASGSAMPSGSNTGFNVNELKTAALADASNPIVRQAIARANQTMNSRGLLNTSMATQAAQEAAIAKALEIAAPDTAAYYADQRDAKQFGYNKELTQLKGDMDFRTAGALARLNNDLSIANAQAQYNMKVGDVTQTNYITMIDRIQQDTTKQVQQINSSAMPYEEKQAAIRNIQSQAQAQIDNANRLFKSTNGWQDQWAVAADTYSWQVEGAPEKPASTTTTNEWG